MGIPIESRLSKSALAKRQRSAALRKSRHVFNYITSTEQNVFGLYQHNLDSLISHAFEHPPHSARLILVSKDLTSPVPVSQSSSSITRLFPIFMRHARHYTLPPNHNSSATSSDVALNSNPALQSRANRRTFELRRRLIRHSRVWESRQTTLMHVNRNTSSLSTTQQPDTNQTIAPSANSTNQYNFSPLTNVTTNSASHTHHHARSRNLRRTPPLDSGIWPALRRSMLLAASADSISRANYWVSQLPPSAQNGANEYENTTTSDSDHDAQSNQVEHSTNDVLSDKAISLLYEVDNFSLWELGCWVGTQNMRTTDIFGILIDILEKTSIVSGSPIESLCIQDNLFSYSTVRGGVRLLKELSGHLSESDDNSSNFFVHPVNDRRVQIVLSP